MFYQVPAMWHALLGGGGADMEHSGGLNFRGKLGGGVVEVAPSSYKHLYANEANCPNCSSKSLKKTNGENPKINAAPEPPATSDEPRKHINKIIII